MIANREGQVRHQPSTYWKDTTMKVFEIGSRLAWTICFTVFMAAFLIWHLFLP